MGTTLLQRVRRIDTLGKAWRVIRDNGRSSHSADTRREVEEFANSAEARLTKIQRQLNQGAFTFKPSKGLPIPKRGNSGIRPIVIAPIESRIVQRAIHDVLLTIPSISQYAENPFSFGGVRRHAGKTLAAVPAAIQEVLNAIQRGSKYFIRSDIASFFTRIPKGAVIDIVKQAANDSSFTNLFTEAITVELENMASLREHAKAFPIYEIGVAQGNSLSPLLGNLLLYDFDQNMNDGECTCIRYVDDFIVLAPDRDAANRRFKLGRGILSKYGMETSREKTDKGDIAGGFEFLGIEMCNGLIRPSKSSRKRLTGNVATELRTSANALRAAAKDGLNIPSKSVIRTLNIVRGIVQGWGSHCSFCNEKNVFSQLDDKLDELLREYLRDYGAARKTTNQKGQRRLLGVPLIEELADNPFTWPSAAPPSH